MVNYRTSVKFIHACNETNPDTRLRALSRNTKLPLSLLQRNSDKISKIVEFVANVSQLAEVL
jgi:hypothetical protein